MPGFHKKESWKQQVCLSMYDLFVDTRHLCVKTPAANTYSLKARMRSYMFKINIEDIIIKFMDFDAFKVSLSNIYPSKSPESNLTWPIKLPKKYPCSIIYVNKKESFPMKNFSVNATKSTVSCESRHMY